MPGRVTGRQVRKNRDGDHEVLMLQVVVSDAKDVRQVELMPHHGEKYNPPNGSKVAIVSIGRAWKVAIACDDKITPAEQEGERRIYSTDSNGNGIVAEIHLKNDGSMVVNTDGPISVVAGGKVSVEAPDIEATADNTIVATAPQTTINGDVKVNGNMVISGTLSALDGHAVMEFDSFSIPAIDVDAADIGGINFGTHVHSDPQGGNTGGPS
jgi:phage gp45-like